VTVSELLYREPGPRGLAALAGALAPSRGAVTNVDSIRIARGMWEQPTISQRLTIPPEGQNVGPNGDTSAEAKEAEAILRVLEHNLPVGSPSGSFLESVREVDY
jgi:hypothetical protein